MLSMVLVALGVLGMRMDMPVLSQFWPLLVLAGYVVLAFGNLLKGL